MVLCHAAAADTTRPAVNGRNPVAGATGVAATLGRRPVVHRQPQAVDDQHDQPADPGQEHAAPLVDGYYSYQLNTVNFRPAAAVRGEHQYEVAVTSGVKDLAGNGAVASTATFTTGT